jgi:hypothetical protein
MTSRTISEEATMNKWACIVIIVFFLFAGCQLSPTPTVTPTLSKQPIELGSIVVEISGLPENTFATVSVSNPPSSQAIVQAERGNGKWVLDLPLYCDACLITASFDGFTSTPTNYSLTITDGKFQVHDANGQIKETANFSFTLSD